MQKDNLIPAVRNNSLCVLSAISMGLAIYFSMPFSFSLLEKYVSNDVEVLSIILFLSQLMQ